MSQNQNPNPTLTIKGKEFPCRITMGAMLRFKRERGKDAGKIDENDLLDLITFIWCCVSSASVADGVEFNLSLEEFADNLEPTNLQVFTEHMNSQKKIVPVKVKK